MTKEKTCIIKRASGILAAVLFAAVFAGCSGKTGETVSGSSDGAEDTEWINGEVRSIAVSYYEGQNAPAYGLLNKSIFLKMIGDWTADMDGIENPKWNYGTFAEYAVFESDMTLVENDRELYYCTFTADNDKCGYVVVAYDNRSLSMVSIEETPYLYDLRANIDDIRDRLDQTELDLSNAGALRAQVDTGNEKEEIIFFTDGSGHTYIYQFHEP